MTPEALGYLLESTARLIEEAGKRSTSEPIAISFSPRGFERFREVQETVSIVSGWPSGYPIYIWPKQEAEHEIYFSVEEFLVAFEKYSCPDDRLPVGLASKND